MAVERVTVIGAGVSGLAAAVKLAGAGVPVTLLEAAPQAGGRCRSYYDEKLGALIDNGNHMLLSGNWAARRYQEIIGSEDSMSGPELPEFSFFDAAGGQCWSLRMTGPLSMLSKKGRPPGVGIWAFLFALVRILTAKPGDTVADRIDTSSPVFHRFWEPLALAILNTPAHEASAWLLNEVLQETFMKGAAASRPLMAREG
ncbi:MAG: FAD-dependent oxidoreductase, partial [Sphingomonadales bacterium]